MVGSLVGALVGAADTLGIALTVGMWDGRAEILGLLLIVGIAVGLGVGGHLQHEQNTPSGGQSSVIDVI